MPNLGPDHTFNSNLDPYKLQYISREMETFMLRTLTQGDRDLIKKNPDKQSPITTSIHDKFNILTYPDEIISKLYQSIREAFYSIKPAGNFSIKMWLNVYKPGQYLTYHSHMPEENNAFYGHVSVKGGGVTTYKNTKTDEVVDYLNSDGAFVISRPDNTIKHRTWPQSTERITFGFDIANIKEIAKKTAPFNFWIPL